MTEPTRDRPKVTTVRLEPEVRAALDTYMKETRRSLNSAVNYLIAQALRADRQPTK
jgi:hypothetical protein